MSQQTRIIFAVLAILVIIGAVIGVDQIRRQQQAAAQPDLPPGAVPIYVDGTFLAGFAPDDLDQLTKVNFVDDEEGKRQEGWLLRDVLLLYIDEDAMTEDTVVTVSSCSRDKSVTLTWGQVANTNNMVMFDLSGRGTLKLVSQNIDKLDVRDEWVQDTDSIDIDTQ